MLTVSWKIPAFFLRAHVLAHNMMVIAMSRRRRGDLSADRQVCGPETAEPVPRQRGIPFLAVTRFCHWIMSKYVHISDNSWLFVLNFDFLSPT